MGFLICKWNTILCISQSSQWHRFNIFLALVFFSSSTPTRVLNGFIFSLVIWNLVLKYIHFFLFVLNKTLLTNGFSILYLQCWDECTASTSINKSILDTWSLSVQSMVRDNSLVSTNIAWTATNSPSDCLVTCKLQIKWFISIFFFISILFESEINGQNIVLTHCQSIR